MGFLIFMVIAILVVNGAALFDQLRLRRIIRALSREAQAIVPPILHDVSDQRRPIPDALAPIVAELQTLGYSRLGEAQVTFPSSDIPPITGWILIDQERSTFAEVFLPLPVDCPPVVSLGTMFEDEAITATALNAPTEKRYRQLNDADFRAHSRSDESLSIIVAFHHQQVREMRILHGVPKSIPDTDAYLHHVEVYRQRYKGRHTMTFEELLTPPLNTMLAIHLINSVLSLFTVAFVAFAPNIPLRCIGLSIWAFLIGVAFIAGNKGQNYIDRSIESLGAEFDAAREGIRRRNIDAAKESAASAIR